MRRLVLLCLLLVLPLTWAAPAFAGLQAACCAGEPMVQTHTSDLATADHDEPCADDCQGCRGDGAPCGSDCPCQGHTPPLSALHHRPAELADATAQAGATDHFGAVPEPFAATPLRPPSLHLA
jgi:hypothetical protein